MAHLEFFGSRAPGHKSLVRREKGTNRFSFIASIPEKTVDVVCRGGLLRVRLDEAARKNEKPWVLDVVLNDRKYKGTTLSHDELTTLIEEDDVLPVRIEGGRTTLRKHDLLVARHALERAKAAVASAEGRIRAIETEIIEMSRPKKDVTIGMEEGKYEVILTGEEAYATRYGEPWRDLGDAPLTVALARDLGACRDAILALGGDPLEPGETPSHYGTGRDMLRLTLADGSELVQDAQGRVTGTRDGADVPGLTGDKLTLSLAYQLEGARAALAQLVPGLTISQPPEVADQDETPGF